MLKEIDFPQHRRYKSRTDWEPIGFFSDCLCHSYRFDLMLGFFSSSAINVLSCGFASFLYRGGSMRLIINDILTENDKDAIKLGKSEESLPYFDVDNIINLKDTLSKQDTHFFECLAWLIRNNKLEIKIVSPKDGMGISHTKSGVFSDGINSVGFDGSCNFSRTALIDNIESITTSCDWDGQIANAKIIALQSDFENVFFEKDKAYNYISPEFVRTYLINNFEDKDIKELLESEKAILCEQRKQILPLSIDQVLKRALNQIDQICRNDVEVSTSLERIDEPQFPFNSSPREYQEQAFKNWKDNNQRGLFAMATGTGKTITSLNCLLEIYKRKKYYKAIILVPTMVLVEQWEKECRKFGFNKVIKVYSKAKGWKRDVAQLQLLEKINPPSLSTSYVIISTYASFVMRSTFSELIKFDSSRTLFIADECHNMGAKSISCNLINIPYKRRIGLSATPRRQFDQEGNQNLREFFGAENGNTFEYSMEEAINNGFLCKYYYYPHVIHLQSTEMDAYAELSEKIAKMIQRKDEVDEEPLKRLLLKRKRIIHKAANKKIVFRQILEEKIAKKETLKYTLVYAPEGNRSDLDNVSIFDSYEDYFDNRESIEEENGESLIDEYSLIVKNIDSHVSVRRFVSESKERDVMLKDFAEGKIDVLTSMKCLDEGVDVPRSELAIFCSSTGNPRQFIQRRGRILRTHKDKRFAEIHDLVVVPDNVFEGDNFTIERNMVASELRRVRDFALLSENCNDTINELKNVLETYHLSIFNTIDYGKEETE